MAARPKWIERGFKRSPSPPPDNNEEPKHDNEENHVPKPPTTLTLRHVIHPTKGTA